MKTKTLVSLALLTSLALCLSYLESLIPVPFPVPGAKLGLTNIVTVYILYTMRARDALVVVLMRVALAGFLFGSAGSILYALSGAVMSLFVMVVSYRLGVGVLLTSILGGISHNLAQLIVACLVTETWTLFSAYGGYLFFIGTLTGLFVGLCSGFLLKVRNY